MRIAIVCVLSLVAAGAAAQEATEAQEQKPRPAIRVLRNPYEISSFYRSGESPLGPWAGLPNDPAYRIADFYRSPRPAYGWSAFWTNGYAARAAGTAAPLPPLDRRERRSVPGGAVPGARSDRSAGLSSVTDASGLRFGDDARGRLDRPTGFAPEAVGDALEAADVSSRSTARPGSSGRRARRARARSHAGLLDADSPRTRRARSRAP